LIIGPFTVHLPVAGLAAELAYRLYQEEAAVHPRMGIGQSAAVGVQGEVPAGRGALAGNEVRYLSPAAKPRDSSVSMTV